MLERAAAPAPGFAAPVTPGGYHWWYLDAMSDDGEHALTVIVFVGSVFSPYYAAARRRLAAPDPAQYCGFNAVLYNPRRKHWAMTERGAGDLSRDATHLRARGSQIRWEGRQVTVNLDEVTVPLPGRLRGRIELELPGITATDYALDPAGRHRWWPVAPSCRARINMDKPDLSWEGHGYFDSNRGAEPLEAAFRDWDWSRAPLADGGSLVQYHARLRDGGERLLALRFGATGAATELAPLPTQQLPRATIWRMARSTQADAGTPVTVRRTLEDTPFYSRSLLAYRALGEPVRAVHESLDLNRFSRRWVQLLLPFRMPRRARRGS